MSRMPIERDKQKGVEVRCHTCRMPGPPVALRLSSCPKCLSQTCWSCRASGFERDPDGLCKECWPSALGGQHPPTVIWTYVDSDEPIELAPEPSTSNVLPFPARQAREEVRMPISEELPFPVDEAEQVRRRRRDLRDELLDTDCRCGKKKSAGETFCKRCYYSLSPAQRRALYRLMGHGYEEAYAAAIAALGLGEK